jgi:hypothetical protein
MKSANAPTLGLFGLYTISKHLVTLILTKAELVHSPNARSIMRTADEPDSNEMSFTHGQQAIADHLSVVKELPAIPGIQPSLLA